jgi:hypothetical protein
MPTKQISKEESVKGIDRMIDRIWDLEHKDNLDDLELAELKGYSTKLELFKLGISLDGLTIKEYMSLTDREWGDRAFSEAQAKNNY